ncbi:MAG: hypothetical protein GY799_32475 [Desulfobulbaceae bacterium]|nr:hypothetical protein [Desulfobulbaceae bacterium]
MGLISGLDSLNSLSQGSSAKYSRSVLVDFLSIEGLPRRLRRYVTSLIKKMKRGKMISLEHVKGKVIASVDGVETHRKKYSPEEFSWDVLAGLIDKHCQIAMYKDSETGEIDHIEVYHRLVVICIITDRGPMPLAWAYQESEAGKQYKVWLEEGAKIDKMPRSDKDSGEKLKQEGELTVLKKLMADLREDFPRGIPFEVLIGDGLYDKATVLADLEKHGVSLIAVHKNEKRKLRQEASDDFSTERPSRSWSENGKTYEGWEGVYEDNNINRIDQRVKIIRVIRWTGRESVDNFFYCSNRNFMTPRFVEWCRYL